MTATTVPPTDVDDDGWRPAIEQCPFCGSYELSGFAGAGDGRAYWWHHACADLRGRNGWSTPDLVEPTGRSRGVRYRTRPRTEGLEDEIRLALNAIHTVALGTREMTAAAWRIRCDQNGVSEQARSDAVRRAVTVLRWLELVDLYGGRLDLADIDKRTPRFRSLIFIEPPAPRGVDPRAGRPRP